MIATDYAIENAAREFWSLAGVTPEYPCDLEDGLTWALPLDVQKVPGLRVSYVNSYSRQAGLPYHFWGRNRRLSGCLLAFRDKGIVFLDAEMQEDERRFTMAHEIAHFLLDYRAPRTRALVALGESVRHVLDGLRPPTVEERLHAALVGAPLGAVGHLMERPVAGLPSSAVLGIETRADRLALELLAPAAIVLEKAESLHGLPFRERIDAVAAMLVSEHGLPAAIAQAYVSGVLHSNGGPSFRDWLAGQG